MLQSVSKAATSPSVEEVLNTTSLPVKRRYENFIGGDWVKPKKGQYFENLSPITGQPFAEIARSTAEDIEVALNAAHAAAEGWAQTSVTERANCLFKIADRIEENVHALAQIETIDNGKAIRGRSMRTYRSPQTIFDILPRAFALRKVVWENLTMTPSPITSTNRWVWWARLFLGISRF